MSRAICIIMIIFLILSMMTLRLWMQAHLTNQDSLTPRGTEYLKNKIGQGTWAFLNIHCAQLQEGDLSSEQKSETVQLIQSLLSQYPCLVCRTHAKQYLIDHPLNLLQTAEDVQGWVFQFHQNVNQRLMKPIYTYEQFTAEWLIPHKTCSDCTI